MDKEGIVSRINRKRFEVGERELKLLFVSDLHLGSSGINEQRIRREFDDALEKGARILIGGDILDAIWISDPRYLKSGLGPSVISRQDEMNAALEYWKEFMQEYSGAIDFLGMGNHESVLLERHGIDLNRLLAISLGLDPNRVCGGYWSVISYSFTPAGRKHSCELSIFYHHGSGGGAPITRGMIEVSRTKMYVEGVDIIWQGHTHDRWVAPYSVLRVERGGYPAFGEVMVIRTGGYRYWGSNPWENRRGHLPKAHGGVFVTASYTTGAGRRYLKLKAEV